VEWHALKDCYGNSLQLPVLSNIEPPALRRKAATDKLVEKIVKHDSWPMQPDILSPPLMLRLTSGKLLWLDLQPLDIKSRWRHNLKVGSGGQLSPSMWPHNLATGFRPPSATVVSAEPFWHGTGTLRCLQKEMATYRHWSVSLWRDPDDVLHCRILSPDKTEWWLISAIHSADEDAVLWLTSYGSWHAYEKLSIATVTRFSWYCKHNSFLTLWFN